jgi:hypothetical protein
MAHANARLTEFGGLLLVQRVLELGWPPAQAAEALGCRGRLPTSGLAATAPTGWPTAAPGPIAAPTRCPPPRCVGCWPRTAVIARDPIGWPGGWACLAQPSMGCFAATA